MLWVEVMERGAGFVICTGQCLSHGVCLGQGKRCRTPPSHSIPTGGLWPTALVLGEA